MEKGRPFRIGRPLYCNDRRLFLKDELEGTLRLSFSVDIYSGVCRGEATPWCDFAF